jgi:acetyl-CoA carboxylase biotin carboxyl carrier protein
MGAPEGVEMAKPEIEKGTTVKIQDIQKLVDMLDKSNLNEIEIEGDGMRVRLSKGQRSGEASPTPGPSYFMVPQQASAAPPPPVPAGILPAPVPAAAPASAEAPQGEAAPARGTEVKSPMVGTFYRSPAPGAEPFVKIGDTIRKGQTLCIIEAMKLMNEIESELDGVVLDVFPENAQPVEYGERLFLVQPA